MGYYIDAKKVSLDTLQKRIEETDLIPSQQMLLDDIGKNFVTFKENGYGTLLDLRKEIKNVKNIPSVAEKTGINPAYLTILRRLIEGYFPKSVPIKAFDWFPPKDMDKLAEEGHKNNVKLFDLLNSSQKRVEIAKQLIIDQDILDELYSIVNLTRIQWISPMAARMLFLVGYKDTHSIASADAEDMCNELDRINKEKGFFKGKIGLRDIKRLIKAASFIS